MGVHDFPSSSPMILQRVEQSEWLSNAYLAVDEIGGTGVLIDSNLATDPLCERVEREGTTITHILLTHHHYDHVVGVEKLAERFGGVPVLAHPQCKELVGDAVTGTIDHGDVLETGDLRIEAIHTPGHCGDHLALRINDDDCLTADVIFKGTVGGTGAPGATGPRRPEGVGHGPAHGAAQRRPAPSRATASPPRSSRSGRTTPSSASGGASTSRPRSAARSGPGDEDRRDATLLLWAPDYDGGNKALVRFDDDGVETITGGSQVRRV